MCFPTVPAVAEAIAKRLCHSHFGYFESREEYFSAIIDRQKRRNGIEGLAPVHIRINLALPTCRLREALARMDKYVFKA